MDRASAAPPRPTDDGEEVGLHEAATFLLEECVAIAFVMAPAAYHRQIGVHHVTETFVLVSTRLLIASMVPLAAAIALDFYLIARLVIGEAAAPLVAAVLVAVFVLLWAVLPRWRRLQRLVAS